MTNEETDGTPTNKFAGISPVKKAGRSADLSVRIAEILFAYIPVPMGTKVLAVLMDAARPGSGKLANSAIERLKRAGRIRRIGRLDGSDAYQNIASYAASKYLADMAEAEANGWLPGYATLLSSINVANLRFISAKTAQKIAETVRFLLSGSTSLDDAPECVRLVFMKEQDKTFLRNVAAHAATLTKDEPDFAFCGADDPRLTLMPYWLNVRFICGKSITKALDALGRLMQGCIITDNFLCCAYIAACFWTANKSGIGAIKALRQGSENLLKPATRLLADGAAKALDGRFADADKLFKQLGKLREDDRPYATYNISSNNVDNVPERLMMATCSAVATPDKPPKLRPSRLMAPSWATDYMWRSGLLPEDKYINTVERVSKEFADGWTTAISGDTELIDTPNSEFPTSPLLNIVRAWSYRLLKSSVRQNHSQEAAKLIRFAKDLFCEGYTNMAALYLSLISGAYDKDKEAKFVNAVNAIALPFLPEITKDSEWRIFLESLRNSVVRAERSAKRTDVEKKNRVVWTIVTGYNDCSDEVDVDSIKMALRPNGGREDGSDDIPVDYQWHGDQAKVRSAMTEKDLLVQRSLRTCGGIYSAKSKADIFSLLVGMDNIYVSTDYYERIYHRKDGLRKVNIVARKCEMRSELTKDGGLELSVPWWCLNTKNDIAVIWDDEDTIAVVTLPQSAKVLLDVFREHGIEGKLTIPARGMKDAAPIVQAMAEILPIAAPTESEKQSLRRIDAANAISVRLHFDGQTLLMQAFAKPVAAMPDLAVSPGEGQAEKVVADVSGGYMLVRDLAAEKALFAEVSKTLEKFETWFDGKFTWSIDDIAAALDALATLKSFVEGRKDAVSMEWRDDRKIAVTNAPKSGVALKSSRTAEDWFRVDGEWQLDDGRVVSIARMLDAASNRFGDYIRLSDGDFVRLTKAMARQLAALSAAGRRKGDGVEICKAAIPMLDGTLDGKDDSLTLPDAMAKTAEEIRSVFTRRPQVPKALNAELRPYQTDGFRWLSRLAGCAFGSCLADDMGLGKTLQIIAVLLDRAKDGASLVIAPSSVCGNWRSEIRRFAPSLRPLMAYDDEVSLAKAGPLDIVIASYNYMLFHEKDFAAIHWNGLVLDEAQAIKNDASKRAKAAKRLAAKFRIAATGTPVENRLGELWSLFDFLNPGLLGPANSFISRFTSNGKATPELKRLVKPLILRRLKNDVLDDLPEKTESTINVELGTAEREAYEACRIYALSQLEKNSGEGDGPDRMSILAQLTRLRRFCCHPSLVLPNERLPSAKMEALVDLLENLRESSHRALVFSQFTDYLAIVRKVIETHGWSHLYLDGSTPTRERERLVNEFQGGEGDFFLISLKAGGTGLNLTAADYVILLDPWWNPAVENQAADRAHRIGQTNPVTVYRLIASNTIEERVIELHREKKEIAEDVLDSTGSASLTPAQLMRLFAPF